jgi:uncharacterized protein YyaL (SSP411 family)
MAFGFTELVGVGSNVKNTIIEVQTAFLPFKMLLISDQFDDTMSLLKGKQNIDNQYFICNKGNCSVPYTNHNDFLTTIFQLNY